MKYHAQNFVLWRKRKVKRSIYILELSEYDEIISMYGI